MRLVSFFKDRQPIDFEPCIERAVDSLAPEHLRGLESVVLRDSRELGSKERKQQIRSGADRISLSRAKAVYWHARAEDGATITLFVDKIVARCSPWTLRIPILRELTVQQVFFHEVGHHVLALRAPDGPQSEEEASRIGKQLFTRFFRRRHPLLVPVVWIAQRVIRRMRRAPGDGARADRNDRSETQ